MPLLLAALIAFFQIQNPNASGTFQIRGKVSGVPAGAPSGLFRATLTPLFPTPPGAQHTGIQSDGTFALRVPPGTYSLSTLPPSGGLQRIQVVDRDVDVPEARLQFTLWGQMVMDDGGPIPVRENTLRSANPASFVFMRTALISGPPRRDPAGFTNVAASGLFTLNLPEGQFAINLLQLPMGYTVKSMTLGSIDLLKGATFRIADATMPVEVKMVLTTRLPETASTWRKLSGRAEGFTRGDGARVVIAPATASFGGPAGTVVEERVGDAKVRDDGTFEIANVPQGRYTLQYQPAPTAGRVFFGPMAPITVENADMTDLIIRAAQ